MLTTGFFIGLVIAYLLGSVPTAVWYGKSLFSIDIREHGSKNAGATNTFRTLGKKAGVTVLAIDLLKGFLAPLVALLFVRLGMIPAESLVHVQIVYGVTAVFGHVFPVFAGFRGGKGVATLTGMMLCIHPAGAGLCVGIFIVLFLLFGYVSLGSMIGTAAFPILLVTRVFGPWDSWLLVFGIVMATAVILTHKKNIIRLIQGTEDKISIRNRAQA